MDPMTQPPASTAIIVLFSYIIIIAIMVVSLWKIFVKANRTAWHSLIPFYNAYVTIRISGLSGWFLIPLLIPLVNIVITFIVAFYLSKRFSKGIWFAIGIGLLPIVFLPILAFGKAEYTAPPEESSSPA